MWGEVLRMEEKKTKDGASLDENNNEVLNPLSDGMDVSSLYPTQLPPGYELLEFYEGAKLSKAESTKRRERMKKRSEAKSVRTLDALDVENEPLKLVEVMAHEAQVKEKDGSLKDGIRVVFLLDDGRALGFISNAAQQFAKDLRYINPSMDFHEEPLIFSFRQVNTRSGNRTYAFTIIE